MNMLKATVTFTLLLGSTWWANAQGTASALAAQPYQSQYSALRPGTTVPTAVGGVSTSPGSVRLGQSQMGGLPQVGPWSTLGGPTAQVSAPTGGGPATPFAQGWSGANSSPPGGSTGYGMGVGTISLAPVNVRNYFGQPGIASSGLGSVQTTGVAAPAAIVTMPGGAELASTGYGMSAQSLGLAPFFGSTYVASGPLPQVVSPAWSFASPAGSQMAYGGLGPPFNVVTAPSSAVPLAGSVWPGRSGLGVYGPMTAGVTQPQPLEPPPATPARTYRAPDRAYWFKLGGGGFGTSPAPSPP